MKENKPILAKNKAFSFKFSQNSFVNNKIRSVIRNFRYTIANIS